jgi:NAD(P)-dependent dehydrogenase (short-subunit alcohol dehydrogenase family)
MTQQAPIIILGAVGGAGEALARNLSAKGHALFLTARQQAPLQILAQELNAEYVICDTLDTNQVQSAIAQADQGHGIAGVCYAVGSIDLKPFKSANEVDFLNSFDLNLLGAVRALQAAEAGLKKAKGSVVLFSTIAVHQGFANHAIISAAKGAVEGLTRALAAEWAPHVRVNAIAPSLSATPLAEKFTSNDAMAQSIAGLHALNRLGTSDDLAHMAAFLLTSESSWMTGQVLHLDGGRSHVRTKG